MTFEVISHSNFQLL